MLNSININYPLACTRGENNIGAPKMRIKFGCFQIVYFSLFQLLGQNSCRSFLLLKVIEKSKRKLMYIASKIEKEQMLVGREMHIKIKIKKKM